jgi:hypothetical protein
MEFYVLCQRSLETLPLDLAFDELTILTLQIQHNTVDACFGCDTCIVRDRCKRAVISVVQETVVGPTGRTWRFREPGGGMRVIGE